MDRQLVKIINTYDIVDDEIMYDVRDLDSSIIHQHSETDVLAEINLGPEVRMLTLVAGARANEMEIRPVRPALHDEDDNDEDDDNDEEDGVDGGPVGLTKYLSKFNADLMCHRAIVDHRSVDTLDPYERSTIAEDEWEDYSLACAPKLQDFRRRMPERRFLDGRWRYFYPIP
jgi:hypothetical protein